MTEPCMCEPCVTRRAFDDAYQYRPMSTLDDLIRSAIEYAEGTKAANYSSEVATEPRERLILIRGVLALAHEITRRLSFEERRKIEGNLAA